METKRCSASRGSTRMEWSSAPSAEPCAPPFVQVHQVGRSLKPATPFQLTPPSLERNRPEGLVPQYHEPSSSAWPGARKKSVFTVKPREPVTAPGFLPRGSVPKRGG